MRTFAIALLLAGGHALAQNLVPNPGFEDHAPCTTGDWSELNDWLVPGCVGDPAYFNACNNTILPEQGVPFSLLGFQNTHSGDGMVLMVMYSGSNVHRKLTAHLTQQMTGGQTYCVQMWVNLGDNTRAVTNTFHGMFTTDLPSACGGGDSLWFADADLFFETTGIDTAGWTKVEGQYMAAGGEEYFTFGNFLPDSLSDVTPFGPPPNNICRMFVDDVWVGSCDVGVHDAVWVEDLVVWPVPAMAGEPITIKTGLPAGSKVELQVQDVQGRFIHQELCGIGNDGDTILRLDLSAGEYIVLIMGGWNYKRAMITVLR